MTSIAYRDSASSALSTSGNSYTVAVPSAVQVGDKMIIISTSGSATGDTHTTPSGWTLVDAASRSNIQTSVYKRTAQAGDAGSNVTLSGSGNTKRSAVLLAYSAVDAAIIDVYASATETVAATTHMTPTATASALSWVVEACCDRAGPGSSTYTPPSGLTSRRVIQATGSAGCTTAVGDTNGDVSSTSVGGHTWTGDVSTANAVMWTIVLKASTSGQTVNLGSPSEADSAQTILKKHSVRIGLPSEATASLPVGRTKVVTLGVPNETDASLPVTSTGQHVVTLGVPAESDTPLAPARSKRKTIGIPSETDTSLTPLHKHAVRLGIPAETDVPLPTSRLSSATVLQLVVGAPTTSGFKVRAKMSGAVSVRLAVSTSAVMTNPSYVTAQIPDSDGYAEWTVTGLNAGTRYYYQLADTPVGGVETLVGSFGRAKTVPSGGSFTFGVGGCIQNNASDGAAMSDLRTWDPDGWIMIGDLHYRDPTSGVASVHRGYWENQITGASGLAALMRDVPLLSYTPSDHDNGPGDNGDSTGVETPASIAAYQQVFPTYTLADARSPKHGRYHAFTIGRVRFIAVDVRNTDRSPGLNAQSTSKTMLGATQLNWLYGELDRAEPVKIIVSDVAWLGAASTANGEDKWWSYDDERTAIGNYITSHGYNVVMLCGDTHRLATATGAANPKGGFPVWCSALMHQTSGGRNVGSFSQSWPSASSVASRAYARITVTDSGSSIALDYVGWDASAGVQRITDSVTFNTSPALGQPSEIDSTQSLTRTKRVTLGLPTESDVSLTCVRRHARVLGAVTELDEVFSPTRSKRRALGQPNEVNLFHTLAVRGRQRILGFSTEADVLFALHNVKNRSLGRPVETNGILPLVVSRAGKVTFEIIVQRRLTAAFIATLPTNVLLLPHKRERTSAGGYLYVPQTPRPPQVVRLNDPGAPGALTKTQDGVERDLVYELVARWDAELAVLDTFTLDGDMFEVIRLFSDLPWEKRAEVRRRGR